MNINKIMIGGNLGKDAETLRFKSGGAVIKFSVATTEIFTDKTGEKQERTTWHNVELFRKTESKLGEYLKKGTPVFVEGSIRNESYDKPDGTKGYATKIIASNVQLLGGKKQDGGGSIGENSEDIPF